MTIPVTHFLLPGVLQPIAEKTTIEIALAVARVWGGRMMYVPKEPIGRHHRMAQILGLGAARIIQEILGSDGVGHKIPKAESFLNWYQARRLYGDGWTILRIARHLKITQKQVLRLVADLDRSERQECATEQLGLDHCPLCGHRRRSLVRRQHGEDRQLSLF